MGRLVGRGVEGGSSQCWWFEGAALISHLSGWESWRRYTAPALLVLGNSSLYILELLNVNGRNQFIMLI